MPRKSSSRTNNNNDDDDASSRINQDHNHGQDEANKHRLCGIRITEQADFGVSGHTDDNEPTYTYETTEVPRDSPTFLVVAAVVNLGLELLESPVGRDAFVKVGVNNIEILNWRKKKHIFTDPNTMESMERHVSSYLQKMRSDFVPIRLTKGILYEGQAEKDDWAKPPKEGDPEKDMGDYVASKAGVLTLNRYVIENIVECSHQAVENGRADLADVHPIQMCSMAIGVARELVNFFAGYQIGYSTPCISTYIYDSMGKYDLLDYKAEDTFWRAYQDRGRTWEAMVLCGHVEHWAECPGDSERERGFRDRYLSHRQAGELWRFGEDIQLIDLKSIQRILAFDFSPRTLPLKLETPRLQEHELHAIRWSMPDLRRERSLASPSSYNKSRRAKGALTKSKMDVYRRAQPYDFVGREFERIRLIPGSQKYTYHDLN